MRRVIVPIVLAFAVVALVVAYSGSSSSSPQAAFVPTQLMEGGPQIGICPPGFLLVDATACSNPDEDMNGDGFACMKVFKKKKAAKKKVKGGHDGCIDNVSQRRIIKKIIKK